jgi:hypothetical protein
VATGTPVLSYQWKKGGEPFTDGSNISGATTATLMLTNIQAADAGSYTVTVTNALGFVTSNPAVLTINGTFAAWQAAKFTLTEQGNPNISGPNAIYGHDGLTNLVKYALGLEPKQNITTSLPAISTTATDWAYTYTRSSATTDLTYAIEVSTDLVNWTTSGVIHEFVSSANGVETWRGHYPLSSAPRAFFRLKVTR